MDGLNHSYLYGIAVDSGDPQNVIVSVSMGPVSAYSVEYAESYVYRRDKDGQKWSAISNGLSGPSGTTISILAANQKTKGEFYAANNRGLFISTDSGVSWRKLDTQSQNKYSLQPAWALAVSEK